MFVSETVMIEEYNDKEMRRAQADCSVQILYPYNLHIQYYMYIMCYYRGYNQQTQDKMLSSTHLTRWPEKK